MFEWDLEGERNLKAMGYMWLGLKELESCCKNKGVHYGIHAKKLSSIFQFALAKPVLFVPVSQNKVDDTKTCTETINTKMESSQPLANPES